MEKITTLAASYWEGDYETCSTLRIYNKHKQIAGRMALNERDRIGYLVLNGRMMSNRILDKSGFRIWAGLNC
jgi:hypothetical protein